MNRAYYRWLTGASLSSFGDAAVFFALGWAASGIGPQVAGFVLTAFTLPRAIFLLAGGVVGDRLNPLFVPPPRRPTSSVSNPSSPSSKPSRC